MAPCDCPRARMTLYVVWFRRRRSCGRRSDACRCRARATRPSALTAIRCEPTLQRRPRGDSPSYTILCGGWNASMMDESSSGSSDSPMGTSVTDTKSIAGVWTFSLPDPIPSVRSIRSSGIFHRLAVLFLLGACGVRYGFSEGAFPPHIHTMAVLPFENQTATPELQNELFESMRRELQR